MKISLKIFLVVVALYASQIFASEFDKNVLDMIKNRLTALELKVNTLAQKLSLTFPETEKIFMGTSDVKITQEMKDQLKKINEIQDQINKAILDQKKARENK